MKKIFLIFLALLWLNCFSQSTKFIFATKLINYPQSSYNHYYAISHNAGNLIYYDNVSPNYREALVVLNSNSIFNFQINNSYDYYNNGNQHCSSVQYYSISTNDTGIYCEPGCFGYTALVKLKIYAGLQSVTSGSCETISLNNSGIINMYLESNQKWFYKKGGSSNWVAIPSQYQSNSGINFIPKNIPDLYNYTGPLHIKYGLVDQFGVIKSDTNGTYDSDIFTINIIPCPPLLIGEPQATNPTCSDSNDGSITYTFDRDLEANEYFLFNLREANGAFIGSDTLTSNNFTNHQFTWQGLGSGNYFLHYQTFINGQVASDEYSDIIAITAPPQINFTLENIQNVLCNGDNTGNFTVIASGGNGDFNYSKDNGATWQTSNIFDNLYADTYNILVRDSNDCDFIKTAQQITISEPDAELLIRSEEEGSTVENPTEYGAIDGYIVPAISGGLEPYSLVSWTKDNEPYDSSNSLNIYELEEGDYKLTIKDANNCTTERIFTLVAPDSLEVYITGNTFYDCNNDNVLTAHPSGGYLTPNTSYTYEWYKVDLGNFYLATTYSPEFSISEPGTYKVRIIDSNTIDAYSEIFQVTSLTATAEATNIDCSGAQSGSLTVIPSGGSGNYSYQWKQNFTVISEEQNPVGLPIGSYYCIISDTITGCTFTTEEVQIEMPTSALIIENSTVQQITSPSGNQGAIQITAAGGWGNYTYQWTSEDNPNFPTSGQSTTEPIVSDLSSGHYTVTVTDSGGCEVSQTFHLPDPPVIGATSEFGNISCFGANDGYIHVVPMGGTPNPDTNEVNYTISWTYQSNPFEDNDGINDGEINNLLPGEYVIAISDDYGNTFSHTFTIEEPTELTASYTATNLICHEDESGAIELSPNGGTEPWTYQWFLEGELLENTSADLNGINAGTYSVIITDANGCSKTIDSIEITQPQPLVINLEASFPITTEGGNQGSLDISVSGGTPFADPNAPYIYSWINGTNEEIATSQDVAGLYAGIYEVTVTDENGCFVSREFELTNPMPLTVSISETQSITCFNANNATLTADRLGGAPNQETGTIEYSYSWTYNDSALPYTTETIENCSPGNYRVSVSDSYSTVQSEVYSVTEPSPLTVTHTKVDVGCFGGNTGEIELDPQGGTQPYSFEWTYNENPFSEDENLTDLEAGSYSVEITDLKGCTTSIENIEITQPDAPLNITLESLTPVTQPGANNGTIDISVSGGTEDYEYLWSNGETTQDVQNLVPGIYTVEVIDENGCILNSQEFTISVVPEFSVELTQTAFINCFGDDSASIEADVIGGEGPFTYQWSLNGELLESSEDHLTGIVAGAYLLTVTDIWNNPFTAEITVEQPPEIIAPYSVTTVDCFGNLSGMIELSSEGGTGELTFEWSDANGDFITDTQNLTDQTAGFYTVVITDENNCSIQIDSIEITQPEEALHISSFEVTNPTGFNLVNGSIDISVDGGTPPYQFQWNTGGNEEDLEGVGAGTYTVTITDARFCDIYQEFTLTQPNQLIVTITEINPIQCNGEINGGVKATVAGGIPGYIYEWSTGANTPEISGIPAGEDYYVIVEDAAGNTVTEFFDVVEPDPITVTFESTTVSCSGELTGSLTANAQGGTGEYTYSWSNGETTQTIENLASGSYIVYITDSNGCEQVAQGVVESESDIVITPTVVNPSCYQACDGSIELLIENGSGDFTITWDDNAGNGLNADFLCAGNYSVVVHDNINGCIIPINFPLEEPDPLELDLGEDQIICLGQSVTLDGSIEEDNAVYEWVCDNGFTSNNPEVTLTEGGTYTLTVTTQNDCTISDDITITALNEEISSEFLVATQTYVNEEIILINVSDDTTQDVNWLLPEEANLVSSSNTDAVISFPEIGSYEVGLQTGNSGGCESITYHTIIVEENPGLPDPDAVDEPFVQEFVIYPNPTQPGGVFTVKAVLSEPASISTTIYQSGAGTLVDQSQFPSAEVHEHEFNINITTGVYWVILRTPRSVLSKKLIVN